MSIGQIVNQSFRHVAQTTKTDTYNSSSSTIIPQIHQISQAPTPLQSHFLNSQYIAAIPVQPMIATSAFPSQAIMQPISSPLDYLQSNVVLTPAQNQIQDQLQRKHEELKHLIQKQKEELRRVSEQLMMARYGISPTVVTSTFSAVEPSVATLSSSAINDSCFVLTSVQSNVNESGSSNVQSPCHHNNHLVPESLDQSKIKPLETVKMHSSQETETPIADDYLHISTNSSKTDKCNYHNIIHFDRPHSQSDEFLDQNTVSSPKPKTHQIQES